MHLSWDLDTAIFSIFLTFNLAVGLFYSRGIKNIKEYAIGNRNFSTSTITATIIATCIGGGLFSEAVSESYKQGLYFIIPALGEPLALVIVGYLLAPRMAEFLGNLSIAEAMGTHKLGSSPDNISITEARTKAAELKNQLVRGINPILPETQELKEEMTFKEFFDNKYIEDYAKHQIKRWKNVVADIDRQAYHLYTRKLSTINRDDVQKIFNDLTKDGKKIMANKCVQRFKGIFNRAVECKILANNPITGIKKHPEKSRDRYLLPEEKERLLEALKEEPQIIQDVILMHLYSAARRSNVLAMCWDNINLTDETWDIPGTETKNGESHLLPLSEEAMEILKVRYEQRDPQCPWVFPSDHDSKSGHLEYPKRAWNRIRKKAGLKDFKLHDLRRTMGSWMAIAGASQYVIGKALNHKSPKSTAIYARLSIDPVREFMNKANNIFDKNTTDTNNIIK